MSDPLFTRALLEGWAGYWAALGFGQWRGPTGVYQPGEDVCSILPGPMTPTTTTAIGLSVFAVDRMPGNVVMLSCQARVLLGPDRNAARDQVDALAQSLAHGRNLQLGLLVMTQTAHVSTVDLGADGDGRLEYSLTFRMRGGDELRQPGLQPPTVSAVGPTAG